LSKQEIKKPKKAGGEPDCTSLDSVAGLSALPRSTTGGIFVSVFNGLTWALGSRTVYQGLGGGVNDNASGTAQNAGELVCGTTGYDNVFHANVYTVVWSGWIKVGGSGFRFARLRPLGHR
jgi:hypothetical protein